MRTPILAILAAAGPPDGNLEIGFRTLTPQGQLVYWVSFSGKPLIVDPPLTLDLQGQPLLGPI